MAFVIQYAEYLCGFEHARPIRFGEQVSTLCKQLRARARIGGHGGPRAQVARLVEQIKALARDGRDQRVIAVCSVRVGLHIFRTA